MLAILPFLRRGAAVGDPQHGDHQGDVGLDGGDHLADRGALLAHHAQHPVAGLGERGECLECLKRGGQPASVALVLYGVLWPAGCRAWFMAASKSCLLSRLSRTVRRACPDTLIGTAGRKVEGLTPAFRRLARLSSCVGARERLVDARERLVAAQHGDRLEDPRRHRRAADGHPHAAGRRRSAWRPSSSTTAAQRGLHVLGVERLGPRERLARRAQPLRRPRRPSPCAHAFSSHSLALHEEARQRPEVGQRLHLLLG